MRLLACACTAGAGGTISGVWIAAPGSTGTPRFTGPLMRLRTNRGIGLGAMLAKLRAAHRGVRRDPRQPRSWVLRSGAVTTRFDATVLNDESPATDGASGVPLRGFEPRFPP
jgi:hypothetical protein